MYLSEHRSLGGVFRVPSGVKIYAVCGLVDFNLTRNDA